MTAEEIPHRPYVGGPFRWRLGLRPLEVAEWIEVRDDHDEQMAAKAAVLADHHETAFAVLDDVTDAAAEVLDTLVDHLRRTFPDHGIAERAGSIDTSLHPLDAAGRLVQEDLVLMVERNGRLVFGGGSVCFPNRWDLRSKLGRTMAEVHAPVARLNEQLGEPIDRFLDRLTPERSFWRLGWGVLDTDHLYQAVDATAPPRPGTGLAGTDSTGEPSIDEMYLRVERETLRRFPLTRCVLFTIRTHLTCLRTVAADPVEAGRLAEALDALPADVADYKQLDRLGGRAVAELRRWARPAPRRSPVDRPVDHP